MDEALIHNERIIKRLIKISENICHEFEVLTDLSFHNRENTEQFNDHINDVSNYLNQESVIINTLSYDVINAIYKELPKYDDNSDAFNRLSVIIDDKIKDMDDEKDIDEDDIPLDDFEFDNIKEIDPKNTDIDSITNKYIVDEEISDKDATRYIDNVSIFVLKKMYERINDTYTDNKSDNKYKKRLINQLKVFKYFVFTLDLKLEKIGVRYKFNLDSIPTPLIDSLDSDLSRNQVIACIEKLYKFKNNEYRFSEINEALFNMMLLEIYLEHLTIEDIDKLIEMCGFLNNIVINSFYGNMAMDKLIKKKEKID